MDLSPINYLIAHLKLIHDSYSHATFMPGNILSNSIVNILAKVWIQLL